MDNLKDKFTDQKFLEKLPIVGIGLVVVCVIVGFVFYRVGISKAGAELSQLQAAVEKEVDAQEQETQEQAKVTSAFAIGKKVATLETQYSANLGDILRVKADDDFDVEVDMEVAVDELQQENVSVVESLSEYFEDNSYQDAWFAGHEAIQHPYWDFGTKYNVASGIDKIPVVWVCYDSSIGGTVLAYTTATLNAESGKFSGAKSFVFEVDSQYSYDTDNRRGTMLGVLQGTSVSDVVEPEKQPEESSDEEPSDEGSVGDKDADVETEIDGIDITNESVDSETVDEEGGAE